MEKKARLAFCKLLLEPVNLLILDEPTNHLDIKSKQVLKETLIKYDGTLIIISHDRDFLDGLVNKVYEFSDGNVKQHIGGIYDFLASKNMTSIQEIEVAREKLPSKPPTNGSNKKQFHLKKEMEKNIRKLNNQVSKLEKEIASSENEIKEINLELSDPQKFSNDLLKKLEESNQLLEKRMNQWESALKELDQLEEEKNKMVQ